MQNKRFRKSSLFSDLGLEEVREEFLDKVSGLVLVELARVVSIVLLEVLGNLGISVAQSQVLDQSSCLAQTWK